MMKLHLSFVFVMAKMIKAVPIALGDGLYNQEQIAQDHGVFTVQVNF